MCFIGNEGNENVKMMSVGIVGFYRNHVGKFQNPISVLNRGKQIPLECIHLVYLLELYYFQSYQNLYSFNVLFSHVVSTTYNINQDN